MKKQDNGVAVKAMNGGPSVRRFAVIGKQSGLAQDVGRSLTTS